MRWIYRSATQPRPSTNGGLAVALGALLEIVDSGIVNVALTEI